MPTLFVTNPRVDTVTSIKIEDRIIGDDGYLSTTHTNEDIGYVIQAVKESIDELREAGFLPIILRN